jgi:Rrf2 family iron-sulfur cluster assembly transcriptional regulator
VILSKASRLGLYALTEMAHEPDAVVSASTIAERFDVSENHIAKVLQQLARAELVTSIRGVGGGYRLARAGSEITMADVVRSIEGPLRTDNCAECPFRDGDQSCAAEASTCSVHHLLSELESQVYYTLESVTLSTLARARTAPKTSTTVLEEKT